MSCRGHDNVAYGINKNICKLKLNKKIIIKDKCQEETMLQSKKNIVWN